MPFNWNLQTCIHKESSYLTLSVIIRLNLTICIIWILCILASLITSSLSEWIVLVSLAGTVDYCLESLPVSGVSCHLLPSSLGRGHSGYRESTIKVRSAWKRSSIKFPRNRFRRNWLVWGCVHSKPWVQSRLSFRDVCTGGDCHRVLDIVPVFWLVGLGHVI